MDSLPDGWITQIDPATSREYFVDTRTGQSHWTLPDSSTLGRPASSHSTGGDPPHPAFQQSNLRTDLPTSSAAPEEGQTGERGFGSKFAMNLIQQGLSGGKPHGQQGQGGQGGGYGNNQGYNQGAPNQGYNQSPPPQQQQNQQQYSQSQSPPPPPQGQSGYQSSPPPGPGTPNQGGYNPGTQQGYNQGHNNQDYNQGHNQGYGSGSGGHSSNSLGQVGGLLSSALSSALSGKHSGSHGSGSYGSGKPGKHGGGIEGMISGALSGVLGGGKNKPNQGYGNQGNQGYNQQGNQGYNQGNQGGSSGGWHPGQQPQQQGQQHQGQYSPPPGNPPAGNPYGGDHSQQQQYGAPNPNANYGGNISSPPPATTSEISSHDPLKTTSPSPAQPRPLPGQYPPTEPSQPFGTPAPTGNPYGQGFNQDAYKNYVPPVTQSLPPAQGNTGYGQAPAQAPYGQSPPPPAANVYGQAPTDGKREAE